MIASTLANMRQGERIEISEISGKLSQSESANLLNISSDLVGLAKQVQQNAIPDLIEKVTQGNVAVSTAALVAKLPKAEQEEIVTKGEKEILETAKAIRGKKAKEKKNNPDVPIESNREKPLADGKNSFRFSYLPFYVVISKSIHIYNEQIKYATSVYRRIDLWQIPFGLILPRLLTLQTATLPLRLS